MLNTLRLGGPHHSRYTSHTSLSVTLLLYSPLTHEQEPELHLVLQLAPGLQRAVFLFLGTTATDLEISLLISTQTQLQATPVQAGSHESTEPILFNSI